MRRQQRSYLASFVYGVVIATGTAVGLMVTHHLLAPPAGEDVADAVRPVDRTAADGVRKWAVPLETAAIQPPATPIDPPRLVSGPTPATPPAKTVLASDPPKAGEAQRALARNIQRELKRVGCYAGALDGDWSSTTQTAMLAFNESVRVQLPVKSPDYILLTLLQGHTARACAPAADPAITAKAQPAPGKPIAKRSDPVQQAVAPVPRPASVAQPRPGIAQVVPPQAQPVPSPAVPPVVMTQPVAGPVVIPSAAPLPGRMAIGGPPPAQITPPSPSNPVERVAVPPPSATEVIYPAEPPKAADRRVAPPRATYPRRSSPTRGTFTELNRNAP